MNYTKIIIIIIVVIVIFLCYRAYSSIGNSGSSSESFQNISEKKAGYDQFANSSMVFGNPLIMRNGYNLDITNFGMNSDKLGLLLNTDSTGLTGLPSATVKITLLTDTKITAISSQGLTKYRIMYSTDDIKYLLTTTPDATKDGLMANPTPTSTQTIEQITDLETDKSVIARYIKVLYADVGNATGVKLEVYGMPPSSISTKQSLQSGASVNVLLYNEKGKQITSGVYEADSSNTNPFLLIRMPDSYDYLINFISFKSNVSEFKLKYGHSQRNHVYTIPCNGNFNGSASKDSLESFYFPNPTMMNYLTFVPIKSIMSNGTKNFTISEISVYGTFIDPTTDKSKYIDISKSKCNAIVEGFAGNLATPYSTSTQLNNADILNNIKTTQNLCSVLETQDKISNEKIKMERNKQYLLQLQKQTDEIATLEAQIAALQTARTTRLTNADNLNLARYQKQQGEEAKVADLVSQRLANQETVGINLNFQTTPSSTPASTV